MTEPVKVLWTGGWDSTFRVLDLALVQRRRVQPIYIRLGRRTEHLEFEAMGRIGNTAQTRLGTEAGRLMPLIVITDDESHPVYGSLLPIWKRIKARRPKLGSQYLRMAAARDRFGWDGLEVSWCRGEVSEELVQDLFIDPDVAPARLAVTDTDEGRLFGGFKFPLLDRTKVALRDEAADAGFLDLLKSTWFCGSPMFGKPCGRCRLCRLASERGEPFDTAPAGLVSARETARKAGQQTLGAGSAVKRKLGI